MLNRSKSAGAILTVNKSSVQELRSLFRRVSPYLVREWRQVCYELGVPSQTLDELEQHYGSGKKSELAYQGLCRWQEQAGREAKKEKLACVVAAIGLKRAEDKIAQTDDKRKVPCLSHLSSAAGCHDNPNRHAKQRALADRLSRPKTSGSVEQKEPKRSSGRLTQTVSAGMNSLTLGLQSPTVKPGELCELKLKITIKGMQPSDKDDMEAARDDVQSTKDDLKTLSCAFVRNVMTDHWRHLRELKKQIAIDGLAIQRLTKLGFNINLFILCHNLGALERLTQSYVTGRLPKIVHRVLVSKPCLSKLKVKSLELAVEMDTTLINKHREVLLLRDAPEEIDEHPVEELDDFWCTDDDSDDSDVIDHDENEIKSFRLQQWIEELSCDIEEIEKRCHTLTNSMNDLIVTLRIIRPSDTSEMTCLQEVIDCYTSLRYNRRTGDEVRLDLVREFIAIVNLIRIKVCSIESKDLVLSFEETLSEGTLDLFHKLLFEIKKMLRPVYRFVPNENKKANKQTTTGLESEMFLGLQSYLPCLLAHLRAIPESLIADEESVIERSVKTDNETHDEEDKKNVDDKTKNIDKHFCRYCADKPLTRKKEIPLIQQTSVHYIETWTPS